MNVTEAGVDREETLPLRAPTLTLAHLFTAAHSSQERPLRPSLHFSGFPSAHPGVCGDKSLLFYEVTCSVGHLGKATA